MSREDYEEEAPVTEGFREFLMSVPPRIRRTQEFQNWVAKKLDDDGSSLASNETTD